MIYNCAIDGGNSTINIVINGEVFRRMFPSIQSDALGAKSSYVNNSVWGKDDSTQLWNKLHAETTLKMDTPGKLYRSEFLFGHMAEDFQKDVRSRTNKEKHQDKDLAKWMITALAFALFETKKKQEEFFLKDNMTLQFNVNLSTGLPYREGKYPEKREMWADLFKGVHRVNFKHPLFKNLIVDIVVEKIIPVIEGEMALTLELNKQGGIFDSSTPEQLLNKKMAIIDIGGHTTELVTIAYEKVQDENEDSYDEYMDFRDIQVKQVTKIDLTDGIERGIATIMEDVITEVSEEYRNKGIPLKKLIRHDIELAFTGKGRVEGKEGWILPEKIYVKDKFDKQAQNLAMDIINKLHGLYGEIISEVENIFLCGGGSRIESVTDAIKNELGNLGYKSDKVIGLTDPIFANVKGYYLVMTYCFPDCEPLKG